MSSDSSKGKNVVQPTPPVTGSRQRKRRMAAAAAEEGEVIEVHSLEAWKAHLQKEKDSQRLIVVEFTANWRGPCRFLGRFFAQIAKKFPHVNFLKVNVDVHDELEIVALELDVLTIPTFLFLKNGKIVDKVVGAEKELLQLTMNKHSKAPVASI